MKTDVKEIKKAKFEFDSDEKIKLTKADIGGEQFKLLKELNAELVKQLGYVEMTQKQVMLLSNYLWMSLCEGKTLTYRDMNNWEVQLVSAMLEVRDHIYLNYNIETNGLENSEEVIRLDVLRQYLRDAKLIYLNQLHKGRHVTAEYKAVRIDNQLAHRLIDSNSEYEMTLKEYDGDPARVELEVKDIKENTHVIIDMNAHSLKAIGKYFSDLYKLIQLP